MANNKQFNLGLVMAGAVSAGAYTAGVLDFMLEALAAWEKAREADPNVPNHTVVIQAMSGASAGAMCPALLTAMLATGEWSGKTGTSKPSDSLLYQAWVQDIDIAPFLDNSDFGTPDLRAALNIKAIDHVAQKIKSKLEQDSSPMSAPFMAPTFPLFLTQSNLIGTPYRLISANNDKQSLYVTRNHADYFRFDISQSANTPQTYTVPTYGTRINLDSTARPLNKGVLNRMVDAAVSSGAFPFALGSRWHKRFDTDYIGRPIYTDPQHFYTPEPYGMDGSLRWNQMTDGGMINNEPLEYVHRHLLDPAVNPDQKPRPQNPRKGEEADSAILMIDPFPSEDVKLPAPTTPGSTEPHLDANTNKGFKPYNVIDLVGRLLGALIGQARFKPDELHLAAEENTYSRFMMCPVREELDSQGKPVVHDLLPETRKAKPALACGGLSAFGGFLWQDFREHDYVLGRRNCQRFLTHHLVLPETNPIVADWVRKHQNNSALLDQFSIVDQGVRYVSVIPLVTPELRQEVKQNAWPLMAKTKFEEVEKKFHERVQKLMAMLMASAGVGGFIGWAARQFFLKNEANRQVTKFLLLGLANSGQVHTSFDWKTYLRQCGFTKIWQDPQTKEWKADKGV